MFALADEKCAMSFCAGFKQIASEFYPEKHQMCYDLKTENEYNEDFPERFVAFGREKSQAERHYRGKNTNRCKKFVVVIRGIAINKHQHAYQYQNLYGIDKKVEVFKSIYYINYERHKIYPTNYNITKRVLLQVFFG